MFSTNKWVAAANEMKPPTPYRVGKAIVDREAIYSV
jgi:hypothetical protein